MTDVPDAAAPQTPPPQTPPVQTSVPPAAGAAPSALSDPKQLAHICYGLFALSLIIGFSSIVGVVLCYVKRDEMKDTFLASHLTWLIRTFWISLAGFAVGFITMFVLIGFAVMVATAIWAIYRIVKGWIAAAEAKPLAEPEAWV
jgi:uncharacterized membrane protein